MSEPDVIRLRHMLEAALEAISFTKGRSRDDLAVNRMLLLSLTKDLEIIGEAASKVSANVKKEAPGIPWMDIVGTRNRLIHAYFDINFDLIWGTVNSDLPPLVESLRELLSKLEGA